MPQVSQEQIDRAKSINLLSYLQTHEPHNIVRQGHGRYILRDHDSFVISNDKWCWNSRGYGRKTATVLAYLIDVRGMDFSGAVRQLTDGDIREIYQPERSPPKIPSPPKPKKPFALPPANANNDRVTAYLRGRGIDRDIIKRCINNGSLYEGAKHNCVFVGFDGDTPRFACERGTTDDYKKDVSGSNKKLGVYTK